MSYSKRMMQRAVEWIAANPDPDDPFIKIPRRSAPTDHQAALARLAQYERDAAQDPTLAARYGANLPELRRMIHAAEQADAEIAEVYAEFEGILSKPWESQRGKIAATGDDVEVLARWLLTWARSGHNTFDLSQDFVAAMLLTDHRELAIADVRLPFPALLITIPDGFARGSEGGHYTKIHVVSTSKADVNVLDAAAKVTAVLQPLAPDARGRVLSSLEGAPPSTISSLVDRAHIMTGARPAASLVAPAPSPDERHLFIYASDGARALYTTVDTATLTWDGLESLPDAGLDGTDHEIQRSIWRIVFGSLAYVTAVNTAVEPRDATRPVAAVGHGKPRVRHWEIGRTIKIAPELVRAARAGSRETAFQVKHRFIVRGHYRNQAHGPERALRTRRWIAPFWKGPEDGAELVHTYKPEAG